jgi:hypothetical protein
MKFVAFIERLFGNPIPDRLETKEEIWRHDEEGAMIKLAIKVCNRVRQVQGRASNKVWSSLDECRIKFDG